MVWGRPMFRCVRTVDRHGESVRKCITPSREASSDFGPRTPSGPPEGGLISLISSLEFVLAERQPEAELFGARHLLDVACTNIWRELKSSVAERLSKGLTDMHCPHKCQGRIELFSGNIAYKGLNGQ
eukprot:1188124-Prorocentrum_minimum.AAC.6